MNKEQIIESIKFVCTNPDCNYELLNPVGDEDADCPKCNWWLKKVKDTKWTKTKELR